MSGSHTSGPGWPLTLPVATDLAVEPGKNVEYTEMLQIGSGSNGSVFKCINTKGEMMAVKKVKHSISDVAFSIMREARIHRSVDHANIVKIFHHQYDFEKRVLEMFLALKQGNIHSLLRGDRPLDIDVRKDFEFVSKCLKQMLQALDYLASENIVHRDIKPANVLYVMDSDNNPDFQLADFGLAHDFSSGESVDRWFVGTKGYMAPELEHAEQIGIDQGDVYKMDVWSLFMTVVWIVDAEQFRNMSRYPLDLGDWVDIGIKAAQSTLRPLRMMAKRLPRERASAAQMLIHLYDGDGLSTPRDQVAPLDFS